MKKDIMYKKERFTKELEIDDFLRLYFDPAVTLEKCRACSGFAKTWSCPDFDFDVKAYWKQFSAYQVIVDRVYMEGAASPKEAEERLAREKPVFNAEMLTLEKDTPGSVALYAQECEECQRCARLEGKPCRLPQVMRYSLEALGGCGTRLVRDLFGFDVCWSDGTTIPAYYILLGGLLKK